jgi:hypothetical protein
VASSPDYPSIAAGRGAPPGPRAPGGGGRGGGRGGGGGVGGGGGGGGAPRGGGGGRGWRFGSGDRRYRGRARSGGGCCCRHLRGSVNCLWARVGFRVGPRGVGAPSSGRVGLFAGISAGDGLSEVGLANNDVSHFITADPFPSPSHISARPSCPSVNPWVSTLNFVSAKRGRALNPGIMGSPALNLEIYSLKPIIRQRSGILWLPKTFR